MGKNRTLQELGPPEQLFTKLFRALELLGIDVQVATDANKLRRVWRGESPGSAQSTKIVGRDVILLERRLSDKFFRKPSSSELMDIVHEAAHIVVNRYWDNEDRGVAQAELMIAKIVSINLYKKIRKYQEDYYEWGRYSYEEIRQLPTWRAGFRLAKARFLARADITQKNVVNDIKLEDV